MVICAVVSPAPITTLSQSGQSGSVEVSAAGAAAKSPAAAAAMPALGLSPVR